MTPEQKARVGIDALLVAAGWHVFDVTGVHFPCSKALRRIIPAKAFAKK